MKVRNLTMALALAGAMALSTTAAKAATVFDFGVGPNGVATPSWAGDQGQSHTYTASGLSVTLSAFGPSLFGAADHLYGKHLGGDENGIGMTNDPTGEHEIAYGKGFIQIDVSALAGNALSLMFGSTTAGEQWSVFGTNTAGSLGSASLPGGATLIGQSTLESTVQALTGGYKYYDIQSTSTQGGKNVLLTSLTVRGVPEPATWGLMIMGVFCIGAALRQQRRNAFATA